MFSGESKDMYRYDLSSINTYIEVDALLNSKFA